MFIIIGNKYNVLDIKAHEEMVGEKADIFYNEAEKKWAVNVSGKFDHGFPTVSELGEGWTICL